MNICLQAFLFRIMIVTAVLLSPDVYAHAEIADADADAVETCCVCTDITSSCIRQTAGNAAANMAPANIRRRATHHDQIHAGIRLPKNNLQIAYCVFRE